MNSMETVCLSIGDAIKAKDVKITNLKQEVHNLKIHRMKSSEENIHLRNQLKSANEQKVFEVHTVAAETVRNYSTHSQCEKKSAPSPTDKTATKPATARDKTPPYLLEQEREVIQIKGEENVRSMFNPTKIWYKGVLYPSPEHAYQSSKIQHVLGNEDPLNREVFAAESAKKAKEEAKKTPFSPSWQKQKANEQEQICQFRLDQDMNFRIILDATEDSKLVHNVSTTNRNAVSTGKMESQIC